MRLQNRSIRSHHDEASTAHHPTRAGRENAQRNASARSAKASAVPCPIDDDEIRLVHGRGLLERIEHAVQSPVTQWRQQTAKVQPQADQRAIDKGEVGQHAVIGLGLQRRSEDGVSSSGAGKGQLGAQRGFAASRVTIDLTRKAPITGDTELPTASLEVRCCGSAPHHARNGRSRRLIRSIHSVGSTPGANRSSRIAIGRSGRARAVQEAKDSVSGRAL
jgi:hypothetical protein